MKCILIFLLVILMLSNIALAQDKILINDDTEFNLGNGYNITLKSGQQFDDSIILDQINFSLTLKGNTSQVLLSTADNKTISNWTYNLSADKMSFDVVGISQPLNMTVTMQHFNAFYNLTNESNFYAQNKSDISKVVIFNFSDWIINNHSLVIEVNASSISFFVLSGYVTNKVNESVSSANITIINTTFALTNTLGYYTISNLEPGNYTIKAIKFPYSNKTIALNFMNDTTLNITMQIQASSGNVELIEDNTPIYVVAIFILFILVSSQTKQINNIKENIYGYLEEEEIKRNLKKFKRKK